MPTSSFNGKSDSTKRELATETRKSNLETANSVFRVDNASLKEVLRTAKYSGLR